MQEDLRAIHRGERALELRTLWTQGGLGLLTAVTTAAALVWVVREAYLGRLTVGDIALFIAALAGLQNALSSLIGRLADMHQALALLGNFIQVLEERVRTCRSPTRRRHWPRSAGGSSCVTCGSGTAPTAPGYSRG